MSEKLTFTMPRPVRKPKDGNSVVRVDPEAYEAVDIISAKTGLYCIFGRQIMKLYQNRATEDS